jgi:hypothetical protein
MSAKYICTFFKRSNTTHEDIHQGLWKNFICKIEDIDHFYPKMIRCSNLKFGKIQHEI